MEKEQMVSLGLVGVTSLAFCYYLMFRKKPYKKVPTVAIIGAGVSGLCTAAKLKEKNIPFKIFESRSEIGGTWSENTYPGCACDVQSILYSFSFFLNPNWSRRWSKQKEILEYLKSFSNHFGLNESISLNTTVVNAEYIEEICKWRVTFKAGDVEEHADFDFLVSAVGQLSLPKTPNIPGIDKFKGKMFHSANWDHNYDLNQKKVAVIGNGASAIQFIPEIAPVVDKLYIYQRTPSYFIPKDDYEIPNFVKSAHKYFPIIEKLKRLYQYIKYELLYVAFKKGKINDYSTNQFKKDMEKLILDPKLKDKVIPTYPAGCKRILFTSDYLPTLHRQNVELITDSIESIDEEGVKTTNSFYQVDTIVLSTGFQSSNFLKSVKIHGLNGLNLHDDWIKDPWAYHGITITNFPNFFILYGPNTNLGHNSIIFMIELQVNYIVQLIEHMAISGLKSANLKQQVFDNYKSDVNKHMEGLTYSYDCHSWYRNSSGRIVNNLPYSTIYYRWLIRKPNLNDYNFIQ